MKKYERCYIPEVRCNSLNRRRELRLSSAKTRDLEYFCFWRLVQEIINVVGYIFVVVSFLPDSPTHDHN